MNKKHDFNPLTNTLHGMDDMEWIKEVEARYEFEDRLFIAISQGCPELVSHILDKFFERLNTEDFKVLSEDKLSLARLNCRVMNISGRIAARAGGLPPLYLHNISEKFGILINNSTDLTLLNSLTLHIAKEYAQAVFDLSTKSYSPLIANAVQYISHHIGEQVEATHIATALYVSPEHLSRKFKQETRKSIPDYINCKRIAMAKVLLSQNSASLTDIALQVGYRDGSYFSKIFKKIEGITPKEYLAQYKTSIEIKEYF